MAHDRRKRSSQPRSSRTVSIQVPLPVLGVLNGVRERSMACASRPGCRSWRR